MVVVTPNTVVDDPFSVVAVSLHATATTNNTSSIIVTTVFTVYSFPSATLVEHMRRDHWVAPSLPHCVSAMTRERQA